jgi:hypothetical protein
MTATVAAPTETNSTAEKPRTPDMSYTAFKRALMTIHQEGKTGTEEGDFTVLSRGIALLNDMATIFPDYARQLADDPEFLS